MLPTHSQRHSTTPRRSTFALKQEGAIADALRQWMLHDDPADIEAAVTAFVPTTQPMRDETLHMLCKALHIESAISSETEEMLASVVHKATLRVIQGVRESISRASFSARRITHDDTHDLIKIALVGDSGVGKTCMMLRFVRGQFTEGSRPTIGMDYCTRQLSIDVMNGTELSVVQNLTVQVWDTAGQEQFRSLAATYYRKAGGIMVLYDANERKSFESVPGWVAEIRTCNETAVVMIVAAKGEGETAVTSDEGEALAAAHDCLFHTVSAMKDRGVTPAFKALAERVLVVQEQAESQLNAVRESISLNDTDASAPRRGLKKKGCC